MKNYFLFIVLYFFFSLSFAQQKDPWTKDQLMKTGELVEKMEKDDLKNTNLIHIGFEDVIPNSIDAGPGMEEESLDKLRSILSDIPKSETVVLYCGCCPMDVCPNIRPAFELTKKLGYTNLKLLDIPTSIKADWIDYDYPTK